MGKGGETVTEEDLRELERAAELAMQRAEMGDEG